MKSERGWLAIDPKGLIGDPCYELANIYGNPLGMAELWLDPGRVKMLTDTFVQKLGYSRERIIKFGFVHNVVSTVWPGAGVPKCRPKCGFFWERARHILPE